MAINLTLHEDDHREMFRIRRELVGWHHATRTTQSRMATLLGMSDKAIHELETGRTMYRLSTLQMWASCFDLRVQPVLRYPTVPVEVELESRIPALRVNETQMLLRMARPFDASKWVRLWVVSDLTLFRLRAGIAPQDMASRLNVALSSVYGWERTAHDPMVAKLFTYARALGGSIGFSLIERRDYQYE